MPIIIKTFWLKRFLALLLYRSCIAAHGCTSLRTFWGSTRVVQFPEIIKNVKKNQKENCQFFRIFKKKLRRFARSAFGLPRSALEKSGNFTTLTNQLEIILYLLWCWNQVQKMLKSRSEKGIFFCNPEVMLYHLCHSYFQSCFLMPKGAQFLKPVKRKIFPDEKRAASSSLSRFVVLLILSVLIEATKLGIKPFFQHQVVYNVSLFGV